MEGRGGVHLHLPGFQALRITGGAVPARGLWRHGPTRFPAGGWSICAWTSTVYWSRGNGGLFPIARARQEEGA